jgi:hypothetical protein
VRKVTTAVVVLLALTGCGGASDSATPGDVPPPATSAPPPDGSSPVIDTAAERERTEQEVLGAYLAGWEAKHRSNDPPDPEFPALGETHTGPALEQVIVNRKAFLVSGRVGRFPADSVANREAEVVSVEANEATVRDCSVDDSQIVIAATGEVVNDLVATALFEGSMVVDDGRWKLRSLRVVDEWDGVAGCAVD